MKKIAQSTGLLAIGGAIAACLTLSPGQLGPQAYARDSVGQARRVIPLKLEDDKASASLQMTSHCDPQSWFDPTPREFLEGCGSVNALPLSPADVNHDGIPETFTGNRVYIAGGSPITSFPAGGVTNWSRVMVSASGAAPVVVNVLALDVGFADPFIASIPNQPPWDQDRCPDPWQILATPMGWLDLDGDLDLDLVLRIDVQTQRRYWSYDDYGGFCVGSDWSSYGTSIIWLENIGFQANAISGDLDGDGSVNTADLSLLLLNFTN